MRRGAAVSIPVERSRESARLHSIWNLLWELGWEVTVHMLVGDRFVSHLPMEIDELRAA